MVCIDEYKPAMAMVAMQFTYAGVALSTRAALLQGMSPRVFVFYRQALATLIIAPMAAYFTRVTLNQNIYFEGIYLASSSMGSALFNLVPAITFVIASVIGMENVNIKSARSIAKIAGTVLCVAGAISMTLLRGPKLLNANIFVPTESLLSSSGGENWLLGSLLLFGSSCCWSFWIILQVPVTASHPDGHLSLSAWMCFMATLQSGAAATFLEQDHQAWTKHSYLELACCFYAASIFFSISDTGIIGSAVSFFVQAWCISHRGPIYCAMFSPLATVIVTILASIFLHEQIYTGSLIGAVGVIVGLYIVLWGKAGDLKDQLNVKTDPNSPNDQSVSVQSVVDESSKKKTSSVVDVEEPFLSGRS